MSKENTQVIDNQEQKVITEVEISLDLLNATLEYLADRPFRESAGLINALRNAKPIERAAKVEVQEDVAH